MSELGIELQAESIHAEARRLRDLEARALEIEAEADRLQTRVHDLKCLADRVRRLGSVTDRGTDALPRRATALEGHAYKLEANAAIRRDCEARQAREAARTDAADAVDAEGSEGAEAAERFYLCHNLGEGRFRILLAGRGGFSTEGDALDAADQPYELYPGHVILPGVLASLRILTEGTEAAPSDDLDVRLIQKSRVQHDDE